MANFYGRYETKLQEWEDLIAKDPENREQYETEMYDYMADCIPFMQKLATEATDKHTIDTIFVSNSKKGVQRKEIFHEYLRTVEDFKGCIEDEKDAVFEDTSKCTNCGSSNVLSVPCTSEDICEDCGCAKFFLGCDLSYKDEQELEKVVTYSYKRDNHFNEWILQFQVRQVSLIHSTMGV